MRWKLLLIIVVAATATGFGGWLAVTIGVFGKAAELVRQPLWFLLSLLIPIAMIVFSGLFLYRHTARRRKLQAALAAILVAILIVASYFVGSIVAPRRVTFTQLREMR
jgi:hypothetical protein